MAGKVIIAVSLDQEADRDLLDWLSRLPKGSRSAAVRAALRAHLHQGQVTLGDIYQKVARIERAIESGVTVAKGEQDGDAIEEPPEATDALSKLLQLD